ncbi:hypothetical protein GCM10028786_03270 [Flaviaesturariibacter terrae]
MVSPVLLRMNSVRSFTSEAATVSLAAVVVSAAGAATSDFLQEVAAKDRKAAMARTDGFVKRAFDIWLAI